MKKISDLVAGRIIETRNGIKYLYINENLLMCEDGSSWLDLTSYDDDLYILEKFNLKTLDIMKIYETRGYNIGNLFNKDNLTLICERLEEKSPTQIELENIQKQIDELKESANKLQKAIDKENQK